MGNIFEALVRPSNASDEALIYFFVFILCFIIYTIFSSIWYKLSIKPCKTDENQSFFNKHPIWYNSKSYHLTYKIFSILVVFALFIGFLGIYTENAKQTQIYENQLSEMIELNTHRYVGRSKIICINDSKYSVTEIDGSYHFLYISDKGLAESFDVPVENTAIYYCNLDDEYYIDIYEFSGERFYVLYIPENTVYVVN